MSYHVNPVAPVLPRLGARSVGAFGATPPTLKGPTLDTHVAAMTKRAGKDAGTFLRACMTDKLGPRNLRTCYDAALKEVGVLKGEQLSFYRTCSGQRASDMPVLVHHKACYGEAKKLAAGPGPAPTTAKPADSPMVIAAPSGGLPGGKWLWIGGAIAAAGLAFVLLKK